MYIGHGSLFIDIHADAYNIVIYFFNVIKVNLYTQGGW